MDASIRVHYTHIRIPSNLCMNFFSKSLFCLSCFFFLSVFVALLSAAAGGQTSAAKRKMHGMVHISIIVYHIDMCAVHSLLLHFVH